MGTEGRGRPGEDPAFRLREETVPAPEGLQSSREVGRLLSWWKRRRGINQTLVAASLGVTAHDYSVDPGSLTQPWPMLPAVPGKGHLDAWSSALSTLSPAVWP